MIECQVEEVRVDSNEEVDILNIESILLLVLDSPSPFDESMLLYALRKNKNEEDQCLD